jgi:hypothetical protein
MGLMDRLKHAAESAQAATSKVGIGATGDQMALANRAKKLTSEGVDTPAHIDAMDATGNTDTPGGTEYNITFTVKPTGAGEYQVKTNQYIYPSNPFTVGDDVKVKVDPADPNVLMIFGRA